MKDEILELIRDPENKLEHLPSPASGSATRPSMHNPNHKIYRLTTRDGRVYTITMNLKAERQYTVADEHGETDMSIEDKKEIFNNARNRGVPQPQKNNTLTEAMLYLRSDNSHK